MKKTVVGVFLVLVVAFLAVGVAVVNPVRLAAAGKADFTLTISPTSETIVRGSNLKFDIIPTGPNRLTGIRAQISADISPSVSNGPVLTLHSYDGGINLGSVILTGTTSQGTPRGTYTIMATATGIQYPIVGQTQTASATLIVN